MPESDYYYTYTWEDDTEGKVRAGKYLAGERWFECERCGFIFPESKTAIEPQTGRRVCTTVPKCLDPDPETPYDSSTFYFRS